uniref:Putative multisubunit Na+/H+ antiporter, MnhA subunit. Containing NADH:ubiquinone oxidoreductase subunit 5 (Chain L) domain n=1 Tax=Magnetococcus massalia (strain MO-1) TaxID=451514 RepID=A0A1S7LHF0_MAGMO|nr:Putative multisubunit Na+/H+ antiporter, MnhA subunit. Containing NADH:ubiquinone oxidoreductase subunit 5 (chain L) domain [Candidatus Magnetococcus massalia]
MLAAPLCVFLRDHRIAWLFTVVASWATFIVAGLMLDQVLTEGTIRYALGGWAPPWGIEYRVDTLNAYVLVIVAAIGAIVATYSRQSVEKEVQEEKRYLFYTAYLLCLTGLLGITITGDAFNVFVFLEVSSLSTYALVSLGRDRRALTAAFQYLIMGTIGATFILIGVGLLYMVTGTLNMMDLAERLQPLLDSRTVQAAFAFLTVGISLKLAMFPLHLWLPNAYTYSPSVVSAFLAGTATKVAAYVLLRFIFTIFGANFEEQSLTIILIPLALLGIFFGSLSAIYQDDVRKSLAYSSVAQIGYIVLGISLVGVTGLAAGILHLFNHALMKGALFLALGCVAYRVGSVKIEAMRGLGQKMPWTMAAFVIGGLSLIGIPATAGFVSKWYLIQAALAAHLWWIAAFVLLTSLMAVVYVWRVVEVAYFPGDKAVSDVGEAPLGLLIPTWTLALANIYFGLNTSLSVDTAFAAARQLLGGVP